MKTGYRYSAPGGICVFEIRLSEENPLKYTLFADDQAIRNYSNPEDAAHDVFLRETGYLIWDQLSEGPDNPLSLNEWEKINK